MTKCLDFLTFGLKKIRNSKEHESNLVGNRMHQKSLNELIFCSLAAENKCNVSKKALYQYVYFSLIHSCLCYPNNKTNGPLTCS